jgi:homoserine O-acetyltransferase/O-succinyltransferase
MTQLETATASRYGAPAEVYAAPARLAAPVPPYEVTGPPTAAVVVTLGGISASRHVTSTIRDTSAGWWQDIVGSGRAIDTTEYRVVSFDYVDGGSTKDGHPAALVSTHDQADALARVLDTLSVHRVHAIVGASYGGMVALAFAERYPERVGRLVVMSAPHETHPMSTALRVVQRRIVALGLETGRAHDALVLARALAMTTYRSADEFAQRFATEPEVTSQAGASFPVESYLLHHGEKFARCWSPSRFLALSLSADLHRVVPERIRTPAVLVSVDGDTIVPGEQMAQLAIRLAGPSRLIRLRATTGHDAFLAEPDLIGPILHNSLHAESIS